MKITRVKGRWLRQIELKSSPTLVSKNGRRPTKTQEKAFSAWARKQKADDEAATDIHRLIAKTKPQLGGYLEREGFIKIPSGLAKAVGQKFRPPSPELVNMMKSLLRRQPDNEQAKHALKIGQEGQTLVEYLHIEDAYDVHPIAYAAWQALRLIDLLESELARGAVAHACGYAYHLGLAMREADALHAFELNSRKGRAGKHNALFDATLAAYADLTKRQQSPSSGEVIAALAKFGVTYTNGRLSWQDRRHREKFTKHSTWLTHYFSKVKKSHG